jgi:hypothetical protein
VTRSASAVEARDDGTVVWPIELHPLTMGILVVALGAMATAFVAVWIDPDVSHQGRLTMLAFHLGLVALFRVLIVPTLYVLTLDDLGVEAGLTRYRLAWADLVRVEVGWSLTSSTTAAWTVRRVTLVPERGRALAVGPSDRLGFLAEVLARAPQLVPDPRAGHQRAWHDPLRERPRHRRPRL